VNQELKLILTRRNNITKRLRGILFFFYQILTALNEISGLSIVSWYLLIIWRIGVARGATPPKKFLENIVILCFERRFSKQNSVIRVKSNILAQKKFFGSPQIFGLAMPLICRARKNSKETEKSQRVWSGQKASRCWWFDRWIKWNPECGWWRTM